MRVGPFELVGSDDGKGLDVTTGPGPVAQLAFGVAGAEAGRGPDGDTVWSSPEGWEARLRRFPDLDGLSLVLTLDNRTGADLPLPPLGLAVTLAPGWCGWSWTPDVEGFIVVAPDGTGPDAAAESLVIRLRHGFWRSAHDRPVFVAATRRDAEAPRSASAAFHLADPSGALRPGGRHQVTLEVLALDSPAEAVRFEPTWLPELVAPAGEEVRFDTPDLAVVPGRDAWASTDGTSAVVTGRPGHREVAVHGVRGVERLRVSWVPDLAPFLAGLAGALTTRRPSGVSSGTGAVVAGALARGACVDPEAVLDWLEREDWLARGDLLGVAISSVVAVQTRDAALLDGAWAVLQHLQPGRGVGLVTMRVWLASLSVSGEAADLAGHLGRRNFDPVARLEYALLADGDPGLWGSAVTGLVNRLGGGLPGQPIGLSAVDAALAISVLRLVPESWPQRRAASLAAGKGTGLLLADCADGLHPQLDGLGWLLLGELGA